jgi:hypothetical protein
MMTMTTPPRRRWFQFSIGSLLWLTLVLAMFVVVTVFAMGLGWAD